MNISKISDSYELLREIGEGGSCTVYLAYHKRLEKYVVIKQLKQCHRAAIRRNEADILKNLHHRNLPQVYDFFADSGNVYTVIDYIEGVTMAECIRSGMTFGQEDISKWLRQMADVLTYLHNQTPSILHCDIKPANIMITPSGDAVLIDFGISITLGDSALLGISRAYASPEQALLAAQIATGAYEKIKLDQSTDIYSLCASFYHLMSGIAPAAEGASQPLSGMNTIYSEGLTQIIDRGMQFDRTQRYQSSAELLQAVERIVPKDRGYGFLLLCRCVTILISAALIASGVYCLITGTIKRKEEAYHADYLSIFLAVDQNDTVTAKNLGIQFLYTEEYQNILQKNPEDFSAVLSMLGDIDYAEEHYAAAASWYRSAVSYAPAADKSVCVRNLIAALSQAGQVNEAQTVLESDNAQYLTTEDFLYASVILAAQRQQGSKCQNYAETLLETSDNSELCASAALAAAGASEDVSTEIKWLERAEQYGGKSAVRGLAVAYARLASESDGEFRDTAIQKSLSCFEEMISNGYNNKSDMINYSNALRIAGEYDTSMSVLKDLLEEYPDDYRILMYLAFDSDEQNDEELTAQYCRQAIAAWRSESDGNRESEDSVNIQRLLALIERYGS